MRCNGMIGVLSYRNSYRPLVRAMPSYAMLCYGSKSSLQNDPTVRYGRQEGGCENKVMVRETTVVEIGFPDSDIGQIDSKQHTHTHTHTSAHRESASVTLTLTALVLANLSAVTERVLGPSARDLCLRLTPQQHFWRGNFFQLSRHLQKTIQHPPKIRPLALDYNT